MGKRKAGQETPSSSEGKMRNVPPSVRNPNAGGRKGSFFRKTLEKTTELFRPKKIVEEAAQEFQLLQKDEEINLKEVVAEEKPEEEHVPVVDPEPEPKMELEVVAEEKPEEEQAPVVDPEPELKKKKKKRKKNKNKNKNKVAEGVEAGPTDSTDDDVPRCPLTSCIIL